MINLERLMGDIHAIAAIGAVPGAGICRRSFSPEDVDARRFLMRRMEEAGLAVHVDAAGNIFGRRAPDAPAKGDAGTAAVLAGSHIDTIARAGRYDGITGVFGALECVRTLDESGIAVRRPIEVVAFSDEEERFLGFLGSYAMTGRIDAEDVDGVSDEDGVLLTDAMRRCGFDPARIGDAARDPASVAAFVELHIEQGPVLEREGASIGVVEEVKGNYRWDVTITGQTDHAGAPLGGRRDAFMAMHRVVAEMLEYRDGWGSAECTLTVGRVRVEPNIQTTQPGRVSFSVDFRSPDREFLMGADGRLRHSLTRLAQDGGFQVSRDPILMEDPLCFNDAVVSAVRASADELDYDARSMYSGAGHDAQVVGSFAPAGMIFIPSAGGRSHGPEEYSSPEDIGRGANVLYRTLLRLAGAHDPREGKEGA